MRNISFCLLLVLLLSGSVFGAITMNLLTSGCDTTNQSTYISASFTPTANALVLASTSAIRVGGPVPNLPALTGNSLTWTSQRQVNFNTAGTPTQRLGLWRDLYASPTTGSLTMNYGDNIDGACWSVFEFAGVDTSGTHGSGAFLQSTGNQGSGGTTTNGDLAAFSDAVNNVALLIVGLNSAQDVIPEVGGAWAQIHDVNHDTPGHTLFSEWRTGEDLTPRATWGAAATQGNSVFEIKMAPASSGGPLLIFNQKQKQR